MISHGFMASLVLAIALGGCVMAGPGKNPKNVETYEMPTVAKYLGDRKGAFSFTFDDGFRHQVENTCEIIEPLGIRGTFFLIPMHMIAPDLSGNTVSWERAKQLHATGHEIGTHGSIREKLHEIDAERLDYLINESYRLIKENTGVTPVSYALPGGSKATEPVVAKIRENHEFIRKAALLPDVKIMGYGNTDSRTWDDQATRERILAHSDEGGWSIAVVHAIVEGWSPFKSKDEFRTHCEWLASQADAIWIAPMGTVGRYVRAREAATLRVVDRDETSIRVVLNCDLEPASVYCSMPLTVVIPAPGAATISAVSADGKAMKAVVRDGDILVDVLPNGAEVVVTWNTGTN